MKNHFFPPSFTSCDAVERESIYVSYVQCTVFGVHAIPVRSAVPPPEFT